MHARQLPNGAFRQTNHCIDDVAVELVFGSKLLEQRERESLAEWLSKELLPALDEVFSFYAPGTQIIRFEQLDFDFGRLPASDYRLIIREQLIQKLTRLIKDKHLPLSITQDVTGVEKRITEPAAALNALLDYLRSGQLKAQAIISGDARGSSQKLHQQLFESLIDEQHIAAQLRALPNREQWLVRLLHQFSERHRVALLRQLATDHVEPALALLELLQTSTLPASALPQLWRYLLEVALEKPQARDQDWFNGVMQKWILDAREPAEEFINYLQQGKFNSPSIANLALPSNWRLAQSFAQAFQQQVDSEKHAIPSTSEAALQANVFLQNKAVGQNKTAEQNKAPPLNNNVIDDVIKSEHEIQQTLADVLGRADASGLQRHWVEWQQRYRDTLVVELKNYLAIPDIRQRLLPQLSEDFVSELLDLLTPGVKHLLGSFQAKLRRYGSILKGLSVSSGVTSANSSLLQLNTVKWLRDLYEDISRAIFNGHVGFNGGIDINGQASRNTTGVSLTPIALIIRNYEDQLTQHINNLPADSQESILEVLNLPEPDLLVHTLPGHHQIENNQRESNPWENIGQGTNSLTPGKSQPINIHQQLAAILIRGAAHEFMSRWPMWYVEQKDILIAGLKHYLVKAELRQQLLLQLPTGFIAELLVLIAPDVKPLLENIVRNLDLCIEAANSLVDESESGVPVSDKPAEQWLQYIYELIATLVFSRVSNDSESTVSLPSLHQLLGELVVQIASQKNVPADELRVLWEPLCIPASKSFTQSIASSSAQSAAQLETQYSVSSHSHLHNRDFSQLDSQDSILSSSVIQNTETNTEVAATPSLHQQVEDIFSRKDIHALVQLWPDIQQMREPKLFSIIANLWKKTDIRQYFIQGLPLPLLEQLLGTIAPEYAYWFTRLAETRTRLLDEAKGLNNNNAFSSTTADGWLREIYGIAAVILWPSPSTTTMTGNRAGNLLQQVTQYIAQQYQLPEEPLYFLWGNVVESATAITQADLPGPQRLLLESQDINETHSDIDIGFPTIERLMAQSDQELFDWCMSLKGNNELRSRLPRNDFLIARLIDNFVKFSPNFSAEFRHYFLAAIQQSLDNLKEKIEFLQKVLFSLLDEELIDLDSIADEIKAKTQTSVNAVRKSEAPQLEATTQVDTGNSYSQSDIKVAIDLHQQASDSQLIDSQTNGQQYDDQENNNKQTRQRLMQLLQELQAGRIDPFGLRMSLYYWQRLVEQFFHSMENDPAQYSTLAESIRSNSIEAADPNYFYQQVIHALVQNLPVDMELFTSRITEDHIAYPIPESSTENNTIPANFDQPKAAQNNSQSTTSKDNVPVLVPTAIDFSAQQRGNFTGSEVVVNSADGTINDGLPLNENNTDMGLQGINLSNKNKEITFEDNEKTAIEGAELSQQYSISAIKNAEIHVQDIDSSPGSMGTGDKNNEYSISNKEFPITEIDSTFSRSEEPVRAPELTLEQLLTEHPLNDAQLQQLQRHVNLLLQHFTQVHAQEWLRLLRNPIYALHLIQQVPGHLLHQIVQRLQTAPFAVLDPIVKLATEALALLVPAADPLVIKQARWEFVFTRLFGPANPLDTNELLTLCCEQLANAIGFADSQRLVQLAERRLVLLKPVAATRPSMSLDDGNESIEPTLNFEAGIHLHNVGMVLASPFLPRLFSMFNLLEDGKFIHAGAADRAVHLLQFMVTGKNETPEYELILNKILCGISTSMPISNGIEITEQEKTIIEQMLQSMIQHWRALGSTSIAGLRETFLQRQGWLVLDDEYWRLKVREHTFDMLLDRLPWTISMIKHAWMDRPLRVSWREQS